MEKNEALAELNGLIEKAVLKFSEYDVIRSVINGEDHTDESLSLARTKLAELVDDHLLSTDAYVCLKQAMTTPTVNPQPKPQPQVQPVENPNNHTGNGSKSSDDKPIKGGALGFVLSFFLGLLGFILALVLGDDQCKKAAGITFGVMVGLSVVIGIIYCIIFFTIGMAAI